MINQQLLDYIRQQLTGGVAREIIKTNLMSQGWSEQDITEGFMTIEKSTATPVPPAPMPVSPLQPNAPVQSTTILNEKMSMPSTAVAPTSMWAKGIPRTNNVFMVISLVLVFGLDLLIIISSPDLRPFWYMMLGVLAVFALFYCLENFVFRKRFANTTSSLDKWISMIIVIRNLIFLLNFIPFIQLLGFALLGGFLAIISGLFGGGGLGLGLGGLGGIGLLVPAVVVLYIFLIIGRYSATKNQ